ncbi:MAG: 4Fe-4S dicluster domain-containing protein, partial [Spirochaetales bacterium]|nr:4Fe-4S dicluster domain-containing protein [Spirochaetales bacterium]
VNGVWKSVQKMNYLDDEILSLKIESASSEGWESVPGSGSEWKKLGKDEIEKILYLSGTSALGAEGIPTRLRTAVISPEEVKHVIVHYAFAEVYNPDISLFLDNGGARKFTEGLAVLAKIMDQAEIHIAIGRNSSTWFQVIENALPDDLSVQYHRVKPKYPQNHDSVLLKTILDLDLPTSYGGMNRGVVIMGIQDVCQVYDAVVTGKPLVDRIIALGGPGFKDHSHRQVKIGTTVADIAVNNLSFDDPEDLRFIDNSVLTGSTLSPESPIGRNSEVLVALEEKRGQELMFFARPGFGKDSYSNTFAAKFLPFTRKVSTNLNGEVRACLSCGFCQNVCPGGILPNILFPYVERKMLDETVIQYGIFKCIDCNLCSYVCPSKIPVASHLKEGKKELLSEAFVSEKDFINAYNLIGLGEATDEESE